MDFAAALEEAQSPSSWRIGPQPAAVAETLWPTSGGRQEGLSAGRIHLFMYATRSNEQPLIAFISVYFPDKEEKAVPCIDVLEEAS